MAQLIQITSNAPYDQVRKELGIGEDVNVVILNFGGQVWLSVLTLDSFMIF